MSNMFNESLRIYNGEETITTAWQYAEELKQAAFAGDYRKVAHDALASFVRSALANLNESNLCSVLRGVRMPADARADMLYHVSYVVAAAGIYLMTNHPDLLTASEQTALSRMMTEAFQHGIIIHGYDDDGVKNKILAMLGCAGARTLLDEQPTFCPVFTEKMHQYLEVWNRAAWEGNPSGTLFSSGGFNCNLQNLEIRWVLACWQGKPHAVFTYGTLMKGQPAERLMATSVWGGNCLLKDYAMYNLGSFPGIKKQTAECVLGELWFVDDATLTALDRYESEGSLYLRKQVTVRSAYGPLKAAAYIYNHAVTGDVIREKWSSRPDDYVWYAAYGSNLSAERFACYIRGGFCRENSHSYSGCADKSLWTAEYFTSVSGQMYFGKESITWGGGVCFFDASITGSAIVRLYRITRAQLMDVMKQEGPSPAWYGHIQCLGVETNGEPIVTLTSDRLHKRNKPSDAYLQLIRNALMSECKLTAKEADRYLRNCMR